MHFDPMDFNMILVWAKRVLNCDHIRSLNLMCCLNAPPDSRRVKSPKPSESPSNSCEAKKGITRSQDNGGNSQQKKKEQKKQPRNGRQQGQQSADWNIFRILLLNHVASAIRRPKWQRTHFNWKQRQRNQRQEGPFPSHSRSRCLKNRRKNAKANVNRWCGTSRRMGKVGG